MCIRSNSIRVISIFFMLVLPSIFIFVLACNFILTSVVEMALVFVLVKVYICSMFSICIGICISISNIVCGT